MFFLTQTPYNEHAIHRFIESGESDTNIFKEFE